MALDEIISDPNTAAPTMWTNVHTAVVNSTNHMKGATPEDANVLCMDGHVEARKFSVAKSGFKLMTNGNGAYWFPNP